MTPFVPCSLPLQNLDWARFIRLISLANRELARYDGILQKVPNPDLLLSPLTTQEAVLSSRIEGTQATLEDVLKFEADPRQKTEKDADILEIINYRSAMDFAIENLRKKPLSLNLIKRMHFILMDSVRGRNKRRGEFRRDQNWIGKKGTPIENATYVPPAPEHIIEHLSNWEKYIHYNEKDPLVQLAIIHAQFEIIHPFMDGNGRVGRMLLPVFLFEKKIISSPVFYLSAYLESHRDEYYQRLLDVSQNDSWTDWINFFLGAVVEQAKENVKKANDILNLYEAMKTTVAELTHSQFSIQALDTLFFSPIFNSSSFMNFSKIGRYSALRILRNLKDGKVIDLVIEGRGSKPGIYIFPKLLDIVKN